MHEKVIDCERFHLKEICFNIFCCLYYFECGTWDISLICLSFGWLVAKSFSINASKGAFFFFGFTSKGTFVNAKI